MSDLDVFQELLNRNAVPDTHRPVVDELVKRGVLKSKGGASPAVAAEADYRDKNFGEFGMGQRVTDSVTFGAAIPVLAAGDAAIKTVGKALTGNKVDPVGDYKFSRDVQDEQMRRARAKDTTLFNVPIPGVGEMPVTGGALMEMGLSLPFAAGGAAKDAAGGFVKRNIVDPAKAGAAYGGVYGFNSARGGIEEHATGTATGVAAGAIAGPVLHNAIVGAGKVPGALSDLGRVATGRRAPNIAENAARLDEYTRANVTPFGPEVGGGVARYTSRGLANTMAGTALRTGAGETINDITRNAQGILARETQGLPVNDLGADLQGTLRQNLVEPSRPRSEIVRMDQAGIDGITGPMGDAGFMPPPPNVTPIPPRNVDPVQARQINPDQVPFETVQPRTVQRGEVRPSYPSRDDVAPRPEMVQAKEAIERDYVAAYTEATTAQRRFQEVAAATGRDPAEVQQWVAARPGIFGPEVDDAYQALVAADRAAQTLKRRLEVNQRGVEIDRDKRWAEDARTAHARANSAVESDYIRGTSEAAREAAEATQAARAKAIRDAQLRAESDAAAETARLRSEAIAEAEAATERARQKAMADYNATAPKEAGFTPGQSKESYRTEFDAAYEQAARATPDYRKNPMGGATPEGRAEKTATKDVVDTLADEARRRLHMKGEPYAEDGSVTPEFAAYLKSRFGNEIGYRIAELSSTKPGHVATTPKALKELRTEIRNAAESAESPRFPEQPRTAEAAALRRLHGALTEDMTTFARSSGGPAKTFTTETMAGEYVAPGSTKIGDMPPSDMTVYVKPEHLERLTGGKMPPNDSKGALPATRGYEVQGNAIMVRRNDSGEVDKATRVPFSSKPEVGLRPLQMWKDSNGIHYGSPITTRGQTPGERGDAIMKSVDAAYAKHMEEMRAPLGKLFGEKTEPIQAMDKLLKAAEVGNLRMLRPFVKVMEEKANPVKAAAAIVAHATNGAKTMKEFREGLGLISKESRDVLFASGEAKALRTQLEQLEKLATQMAPYEKAIAKAKESGLRVRDVPLGMLLYFHFIPTMIAYAGTSGVSKFMASPRFVKWLTDAPKIRTPSQITEHVSRFAFLVDASNKASGRGVFDQGEGKKIKASVKAAAAGALDRMAVIGTANAAGGGEGPPAGLRGEGMPAPQSGLDDMASRVAKAATSKGINPDESNPQDVINAAWDASPTDGMATDIELIAKKYRLRLPWDK